jgi:enamine deaminase RidA (YjgF/YER057c/UK114 family)
MVWRSLTGAVVAAWVVGLANCPAVGASEGDNPIVAARKSGQSPGSSVQYLSQAVVVQGLPLVHTRQLLPLDREGKLVGEGSVDQQIEQVLGNLEAVLGASGSGLGKLVRLNVYALSPPTVDRLREQLSKRLDPAVRPAITAVLTPLPHRKALVAVDAVAVAAEKGPAVTLQRCQAVAGDKECADAAVMPRGGVAYLSGQPEEGGLAASAVARSLSTLLKTLGQLKLAPAQVVQVKVFLRPATSADEALRELKKLFPGQVAPPVVFVEWIASVPVEIELIAYLPPTDKPAQSVEYYNPPDARPSPTFSRAALVRSERQVYISGLCARGLGRGAGNGEAQATDVFEQLKEILDQTGGDMLHLAKASYYVCDDDAGRAFDKVRPKFFDPKRPPAASKVTVHGVGQADRTLTMDMIAVGSGR